MYLCCADEGSKDNSQTNNKQLSQCTSLLPVSDVEAVASLLKRFLGLEELQRRKHQEEGDYGEDEEDSLDSSSDSAEEREEH